MSKAFPIFLIDLDGVLLEPHGYRQSVQAALLYFTEKMGLGDHYPGEDAIARFEAINMTCEWDIAPIILAAVFEALAAQNPGIQWPSDLEQACAVVRSLGLKPSQIDLGRILPILAQHFKPGMEYATLALELSQPDAAVPLYPHLAGHPLLTSILADTRLIHGALTTRVFQHFTLGSERYETTSHLPRLIESESYLQKYDRPLLHPDIRQALLSAWQQKRLGAVVYTARPSLPVKGGVVSFNYSPEAEVALESLGLSGLPLVAAGKMGWLANEMGIGVDRLTKPSPVQALAAISTAFTRQAESSLWSAAKLFIDHESKGYQDFPPLSIHVFEDAGGNINSVRHAAKLLSDAGVQNRVTAWGIAKNVEKQQALLEAGATLMPDINQAIQAAFDLEGIQS